MVVVMMSGTEEPYILVYILGKCPRSSDKNVLLGSPKFSLLKGRELPLWCAAPMACRQGGDWQFSARMHHTSSGHLEMEMDGKGFWVVRMTGGLCWLNVLKYMDGPPND